MIQNPVGYVPPVVRNLIILNIIMFVAVANDATTL